MEIICCIVIGYLIGTFNPSYILGKLKGYDIRERGSGNAGASNAVIQFGKVPGILCAVLDIAKPCLAIWIAKLLFPAYKQALILTGVSCILGHMFPFYMKYRGGKGLACLAGVVLAFDIRVFAVLVVFEVILALVTDYICFIPITVSIIFPAVHFAMNRDIIAVFIIMTASVCILLKHIENIRRIKNGTELRISFLWKKEIELDRVEANSNKQN